MLVAAHGNSIRALRKHLEGISDEDIVGLNVPTGIPYRLLLNDDLSVHSADFLGDPAAAAPRRRPRPWPGWPAITNSPDASDLPGPEAARHGGGPGCLAAPRPNRTDLQGV